MGLWTVKHIVTRHGGSIYVTSNPGAGTSFVLTWPRHASGTLPSRKRANQPDLSADVAPTLALGGVSLLGK